jgi:hypothetical protein
MKRGLSGDVLFELTMQHITDLRSDAENGREYRRNGGDSTDREADPADTTTSSVRAQRPQPSH